VPGKTDGDDWLHSGDFAAAIVAAQQNAQEL
jgi:hypothetical protein